MRYIISDIHGCKKEYLELLRKIKFSDEDHLYILGDVLDRGEDPIGVLLDVMNRKNVTLIMGNHEHLFYSFLKTLGLDFSNFKSEDEKWDFRVWLRDGGLFTFEGYLNLTQEEKKSIYDYIGSRKACFCKAGYMLRDWDDSGQVYEPKTVKSAYLVNCESTFAYLFGIDLFTNEFVWLNVAKNSKSRVAGDTNLSFLTDYFHLTDVMNMYDFFSMMAEKIVEDHMEADVVVTDHEVKCIEEAQIIREYDFEKIRMLMEDAK